MEGVFWGDEGVEKGGRNVFFLSLDNNGIYFDFIVEARNPHKQRKIPLSGLSFL